MEQALGSWSGVERGEEPDEQPETFHMKVLAVSKQDALSAQARDRLDSDRRLILRPYSSLLRWLWLTGAAAGR